MLPNNWHDQPSCVLLMLFVILYFPTQNHIYHALFSLLKTKDTNMLQIQQEEGAITSNLTHTIV